MDRLVLESHFLILHVEGSPLTPQDTGKRLVLVDASWRNAEKLNLHKSLASIPKRSIKSFVTVYPRKSYLYQMPEQGLASVEALYVASIILGREDKSYLDFYHWKENFLESNKEIMGYWREEAKRYKENPDVYR